MLNHLTALLSASLLAATAAAQDTTTLERGRAAYRERRSDDAIALFEKAVAAQPDSLQPHMWLGRAYVQAIPHANFLRQPILARRARTEFDRAVQIDPRNVDVREDRATYYMYAPSIAGGGMDRARAEAEVVRGLNAYRGAILRVQIELHAHDARAAEQECVALVKSHPDSVVPFNTLASLYQSAHRYAEAFEIADQRAAAMPGDPWARFQLGKTAALSGERLEDGETAMRAYLQTGRFAPTASEAHARYRLGMILEQRHDAAGARSEYETATRLDPGLADAKQALRRISP